MAIGDSFSSGFGLDSVVQSIKSAAGLISASQNNVGPIQSPWGYQNSNIQSAFFPFLVTKPSRWDQLFPYRLMVIDITNNRIVRGRKGALNVPTVTVRKGTDTTIVEFEQSNSNSWIYTLPISPQQLTITDQYAINTTATLRGVLEEHNGVKFKMISASGSFGIWPYRSALTTPPSTPSVIQSLFGGTLEALGSVVQSVNSVINTATGNAAANKPTSLRPETSAFGPSSTGYSMALELQQFLEQYAEAKKDPKNAAWRLVFDIPKQNQSLVVTPMQYNWQQNANKPMEFMYTFQLKAWRRIDLNQPVTTVRSTVQPISPGILQRVLNTLSEARQTCSSAINLIGAVRSDVDTIFNVLRQTTMFVKDLAGVAITAADLPSQLAGDFQSAISTFVSSNSSSFASQTSDPSTRSSISQITSSQNSREGLSVNAVSGGQLGNAASINQTLNPDNNIFANPNSNFSLMDMVPVSSLSLSNAQQNSVGAAVNLARATTVSQLKQYRAVIQSLALQLSNSFGTGSTFYSKVYNQPAPTSRIQPITLDEYDILEALYDVMQSYDILTATTQIDDDDTASNMEYVAGLADLSGIEFNIPTSKILVPVPFGKTIEGIAARYLGDPQRWLEIATLNNLRDPYIDENGFQLPLLSNATGRQITVSSDDNMYVGQRVILMSATQVPSARAILGIDQLSDTSFLLTLDGLANLDNFVVGDKAYLQFYLPGTVNSQQKIFIPSDLPVPTDPSIIAPPSTTSDPLTGLSKVDWLLTDTGDIAVNNYGDFRVASGITNINQALKIKFSTFQGTVLTHPTFGLNVRVGTSASDVDLQNLYNAVANMIAQDPRFQQIEQFQIVQNGPTLALNLAVSLPNQTGVFPVSFNITASS